MHTEPAQRKTALLCAIMAVGMVVVGWWPLAFLPANHVEWLRNRAGLHFRPNGIAYDPEPASIAPASLHTNTPALMTLELWVEPDLASNGGITRLLTFHSQRLPSNFALCQWKTTMLLRIPGPNLRGFREVGVSGALEAHTAKLVTLTCGPEGTTWYLDGALAQTSPRFTVPADTLNGRLVLGDAAEGKCAWSGNIYGLALFNRSLDAEEVRMHFQAWTNHAAGQFAHDPHLTTLLLFDEGHGQWVQDLSPNRHRIFIPRIYHTLHKIALAWPAKGERLNVEDVWINLLGFVPFGFVFYWHRRLTSLHRRVQTAGIVILAGTTISLFIEVTQVWLPNRDSSSLDLLCNTLGTVLGVCLAILIRSGPIKRRKRRAK